MLPQKSVGLSEIASQFSTNLRYMKFMRVRGMRSHEGKRFVLLFLHVGDLAHVFVLQWPHPYCHWDASRQTTNPARLDCCQATIPVRNWIAARSSCRTRDNSGPSRAPARSQKPAAWRPQIWATALNSAAPATAPSRQEMAAGKASTDLPVLPRPTARRNQSTATQFFSRSPPALPRKSALRKSAAMRRIPDPRDGEKEARSAEKPTPRKRQPRQLFPKVLCAMQ